MDTLKEIDKMGELFEKWNEVKIPFKEFNKVVEKIDEAFALGVIPTYAENYDETRKQQEALLECYKALDSIKLEYEYDKRTVKLRENIKIIIEVAQSMKDKGIKADEFHQFIRSYLRKYEDGWDKKKEELKRRSTSSTAG